LHKNRIFTTLGFTFVCNNQKIQNKTCKKETTARFFYFFTMGFKKIPSTHNLIFHG